MHSSKNSHTTKKFLNLISDNFRHAYFHCRSNGKRDTPRFMAAAPNGALSPREFHGVACTYRSTNVKSNQTVDMLQVSSQLRGEIDVYSVFIENSSAIKTYYCPEYVLDENPLGVTILPRDLASVQDTLVNEGNCLFVEVIKYSSFQFRETFHV